MATFRLAFEILIFLYFCTRIRRLALETKMKSSQIPLASLDFFYLKLSLDFGRQHVLSILFKKF